MGPKNTKFEKRNDLLKIFQLKNFIIKNKPINEIIHINQTINIGLICRFFEKIYINFPINPLLIKDPG